MTAVHARAARRERQTAAVLGSTRVKRARGESAPDVEPIVVGDARIIAEVKSRKRLPAIVTGALEQASRYAAGRGVPMSVVYLFGASRGIASMWLEDLAALLGIDVQKLPKATPLKRPPPSKQVVMEFDK